MTFFVKCKVCGKPILGSDEFGCQCGTDNQEIEEKIGNNSEYWF